MSVHLGARDVLTWAVEREAGMSAIVTEAKAGAEVLMPLDTLRMLADQLYTVLMTLVEGESFDILVGSGSGEGLGAWRRLTQTLGPLDDWKSKRVAQRNSFSWTQGSSGVANVTRLQRTSEWRRWRHLFPKSSSDTANSNGRGWTRTRN